MEATPSTSITVLPLTRVGSTSDKAAGHHAWSTGAGPRATVDAAARARRIRRMERLALLLDSAVRIPGTDQRVGFDAMIGMIPVVGDALSLLLSLYIVFLAYRIGAPGKILALMLLNVTFDFVLGLTPVVGDAADVLFKANVRNLKLLGITARW